MLAIGLVVATTTVVAVVAHAAVDGMSWSAAFVLGAVVSRPIRSRRRRSCGASACRDASSVIEGESLVNDGTALVLYRVAVGRRVRHVLVLGRLLALRLERRRRRRHRPRRRLLVAASGAVDNPPVEVTISLMTGYLAFLPANAAEASGVLAVVTAGIYLGWRTPELTSVQTRLQGDAVWEILMFVLNALLFALVGLQLDILDALAARGLEARWWALIVAGAIVVTRLVFVPPLTYLPLLGPSSEQQLLPVPLRSCSGRGCAAPSRSPPRSPSRCRRTPATRFRTAT